MTLTQRHFPRSWSYSFFFFLCLTSKKRPSRQGPFIISWKKVKWIESAYTEYILIYVCICIRLLYFWHYFSIMWRYYKIWKAALRNVECPQSICTDVGEASLCMPRILHPETHSEYNVHECISFFSFFSFFFSFLDQNSLSLSLSLPMCYVILLPFFPRVTSVVFSR